MENEQLEQKSKINLEKFKIIADQSNNGIAIVDLKGDIQYINYYFAEIHGYSPNELVGKNLSIFHTEDQMKDVREINKNLIQIGSYSAKEVWHKHKDGTQFLMLMNAIVIKDDQGKPEYLAATAIDVTKQKRIQKRYKFLFESSRDAIMILEPPEWKFTRGNPATIEMFKAKNEKDFCSRAPWQYSPKLQPDNKPSKEKAMEIINKALRKGSHFFEWTHKRLNGEVFPATVLLSKMEIGERKFL